MDDSADIFKAAYSLIKYVKIARERQDTKKKFFKSLRSDHLPELLDHADFRSYMDVIWENSSRDEDSIRRLLNERYTEINGKFSQAQVLKNATIAYQLLTHCAKEEFNRPGSNQKNLDCLTKIVLKRTKALISSNGEDKVLEVVPIERRIDDFGSWELDRLFGHMKLFLVSSDLSQPLPEQWRCDKDTKFRVEERDRADPLLSDIWAGEISLQQFLQKELAISDIRQLSSMKEKLQSLQILSVKDLGNVTNWSDLKSSFPAHYKQLESAIKRYSNLNKKSYSPKKDERTEAELLGDWNKVRRFMLYEAGLEDELKKCGQLERKALEKGFDEQKKNKDFDGGPSLGEIKEVLQSFTTADQKLRKNSQGIMLYGPPGTGKTELCKVIINKAGLFGLVPPLASSELNRSKVGETEQIVMAIFHRALYVPYLLCCIAIDEIDALVPKRNDKSGEHKVDVLCLLLSLLGGIKNVPNVFMIASTNRLSKIDGAFSRRLQDKFYIGRLSADEAFKLMEQMDDPLVNLPARLKTDFLHDNKTKSLFKVLTANFSGAAVNVLRSQLLKYYDLNTEEKNVQKVLIKLSAKVANDFQIKFGGYCIPELIQNNDIINLEVSVRRFVSLDDRLTGRVLIDLCDSNIQLEKIDGSLKEIKLKDLDPRGIKFTAGLVPSLLVLANFLKVPYYQLIDCNLMLENSAFEQNAVIETILEKLDEFKHYKNSMLIFDADTLVGVTESSSDSSMSESTSSSIQNSSVWQVILHNFQFGEEGQSGSYDSHRWCVIISSREFLINQLKKSAKFQLSDNEKEYREKERKCVNCEEKYFQKDNRSDACSYHPNKVLESVSRTSDGKVVRLNKTKEELHKKAIEKGLQDETHKSYFYSCCMKQWNDEGCKKDFHKEPPKPNARSYRFL